MAGDISLDFHCANPAPEVLEAVQDARVRDLVPRFYDP